MSKDQDEQELKHKLQKMAAENPQREVSYQQLFSPSFMQKYTGFANFAFFMQNLKVQDFSDLTALDQNELDAYVKNNSHFKTWAEMQQAAVNNYMQSLF